jgi:alkylmercury lyase
MLLLDEIEERNTSMMNSSSPNMQKALKTHIDFVAEHPEQFRLALPLWRLLAEGKPVAPEALASALHRSLPETRTLLQTWDHRTDQEGNIIAAGLSLVPAPHQFHLDGLALFTWCALDALAFPAMLGRATRVTSRCPATGQEIRLTVTPLAIMDLSPEPAVVSVRLPVEATSTCTIQEDICNDGRFFVSQEAASAPGSLHPQAVLLSIEEAAELGRVMARQILALEQERGDQYSI